jgi:cytochrome P450
MVHQEIAEQSGLARFQTRKRGVEEPRKLAQVGAAEMGENPFRGLEADRLVILHGVEAGQITAPALVGEPAALFGYRFPRGDGDDEQAELVERGDLLHLGQQQGERLDGDVLGFGRRERSERMTRGGERGGIKAPERFVPGVLLAPAKPGEQLSIVPHGADVHRWRAEGKLWGWARTRIYRAAPLMRYDENRAPTLMESGLRFSAVMRKDVPMPPHPYRSIPGPKEIPLIGSVHRRFGGPLDFFRDLKEKCGDAARFTLFNERFLLLADPALVNEVLVTKQNLFRKGKALEGARVFLGNSLLVSEGEEHTRQRRLIQPAFHRGRIGGYAQIMAEKARQWTEARRPGEEIDLAVEMNRLTLAVVAATLFGSDVDAEAGDIAKSLTVVIENFNRMLLPFWGILRRLPTRANLHLRKAQRTLDATIYRVISQRRRDGRDHGDLLSMLLAAEDAENPQKRLTDTEVRDQAMTLFLAGHETTANALAWTWHLLALHEPARAKMKAEIDAALGAEQLPGLDDTARLPYTTAVLSESMRLFPPVWVVGRRALEDVTIGAYEVPRRTIVIASQYLIHRDERYWPHAEEFQPERWLDEAAQAARPKFAYFPFGGGGRVCIGEAFAWTEGVILLAVMARRWRFEAASEQKVELNPTVTLRPKHGLKMTVRAA